MEFNEYKRAYEQLLSTDQVDRDVLLAKINTFLNKFPDSVPAEERADATIQELTLSTIYQRTVKTIIDIIEDVAAAITHSQYTDNRSTRRSIVYAFLRDERRMYLGVALICVSFILYFIGSSS